MTAHKSNYLTCNVCRKAFGRGEEYLVRMRAGRKTTVHRHLCFPPAVTRQASLPPSPQSAA